jgi:hypothetical protein
MQKFKESAELYFISSHYHGEKVQSMSGMLLHTIAIRGTLCNSLLQIVPR